ncbi:MAG: hypothetical protein M3Y28_04700 [Armatimonadota bacterium]|nr:hypothetical protein [Armatimonadota bacterium]
MNDVEEKTRLIRVLTYGKEAVPSGQQSVVGEWANALCLTHGLQWQRVGRDVLFAPGD